MPSTDFRLILHYETVDSWACISYGYCWVRPKLLTLTTADYDLVGPVKSCELFTKFGSILLEFNPEGTLTNAKTSYGEKEYENISFHFVNDTLSQKNIEYFVGLLDNAKLNITL